MLSLNEFINESYLDEYTLIYDGDVVLEKNDIMFPKNNQSGRCKIYIGKHGKERMEERKVSEREILDAIFGAYKELSQKFEKGEIKQTLDGESSTVIIIDARKNKTKPVSVALFIQKSYSNTKLKHPSIVVKTVYKGDDFAAATRGNQRKGEVKIFLY